MNSYRCNEIVIMEQECVSSVGGKSVNPRCLWRTTDGVKASSDCICICSCICICILVWVSSVRAVWSFRWTIDWVKTSSWGSSCHRWHHFGHHHHHHHHYHHGAFFSRATIIMRCWRLADFLTLYCEHSNCNLLLGNKNSASNRLVWHLFQFFSE